MMIMMKIRGKMEAVWGDIITRMMRKMRRIILQITTVAIVSKFMIMMVLLRIDDSDNDVKSNKYDNN